jgi:hypothetical protein
MADSRRKLMPYEHQLIEALGITKEEYLDFVAQQQLYTDIKQGTVLDVRNDFGVVALVLTIIGTILQVAAALLAEKPKGQRTQTRDDVFAPRSGFNSLQELGDYGDPVNLIYTNTEVNRNGGVRVATSLLWSAVKSYGSSQYVQLLLLVGAGGIGSIDPERAAFGQTPLRDLISQNYWLYFKPNGTGEIRQGNLITGATVKKDPATIGSGKDNIYKLNPGADGSAGDGFSHAISPSTSNRFGVYAPVPLNIELESRFESGRITRANNQIKARDLTNWGESSKTTSNRRIEAGSRLTITLRRTNREFPRIAEEEAAEFRRTVSTAFDNAGIMKLGSAKFVISSISNGSTDDGDMSVTLSCIEAGRAPSSIYDKTVPDGSPELVNNNEGSAEEYNQLAADAQRLLDEDERDAEITNALELANDGRIYTVDKRVNTRTGIKYTYKFKRNLTKAEKDVLKQFATFGAITVSLKEDKDDFSKQQPADPNFFTKALVKIETANYETLSPCHIVDFAIKARVWRRISGRQERYGRDQFEGYPGTDNGIKRRSAMFVVKYRRAGQASFDYVRGIFVVRRAADIDNFVYFRFNSGQRGIDNAKHWQFEIEPVHDTQAEFADDRLASAGGNFRFFYLENSGNEQVVGLPNNASISFVGSVRTSSNRLPPLNNSPRKTNEWDLFSHTADTQVQMSFDQGPEFTITAVTEQIAVAFDRFSELYNDISLAGFNMYSGRNVQDLRSFSMFVTQGRRCRLLRTSGDGWGNPGFNYLPAQANGYANTAPDIFLDTVLDKNDGIGKYSGNLFSVDIEQLARSKKFCERNDLFMDGAIAEPSSWRQFWANNAPFSLLELVKADGKESLIPAVPYQEQTGRIASEQTGTPVRITALFNQGNILEDSYKEEFIDYGNSTEDVIVTLIYRDNEREGVFPRKNSVEVKLRSTDENSAIRETIDMSAFVTNRDQAILVGKFLCQTRRHSRRAIEFKTFPTDSLVAPGTYIYVELAQNQWDGIHSGIIGPGGVLDLPLSSTGRNGNFQFLMYNPNNQTKGTIFKENVPVSQSVAPSLAGFEGFIFVLGNIVQNKRVFRVTEVSMDEEGEVTVRGVEHPTTAEGYSRITNGLTQRVPNLFTIDGRAE